MTIKFVFFDAGETILHPHPSFPELFASTASLHGHDVSPEEVAPVLYGMVRNLSAVAEEAGVENPSRSEMESRRFWTYLYLRCLERLGIDDENLPDKLYEVFSDSSTYRLFDDALPTLARLSEKGYGLGLISNFEGWLEELLVALEVGHVFDVSIISGIEGVEKPDLRIYRLAIERAGITPAEGLHVGDSVRLDVEPAASVGLHAVLLDRSRNNSQTKWATIGSLEELPALVAKL